MSQAEHRGLEANYISPLFERKRLEKKLGGTKKKPLAQADKSQDKQDEPKKSEEKKSGKGEKSIQQQKLQSISIPKMDDNQVAKAILKILKNPDLAKEMGRCGEKLVRESFSCDKVAKMFVEEYTNLIKYG